MGWSFIDDMAEWWRGEPENPSIANENAAYCQADVYNTIDGEIAYTMYHEGAGTHEVQELVAGLRALQGTYATRRDTLKALGERMKSAVEGGTGDAAADAAAPMNTAMDDISTILGGSGTTTQDHTNTWHDSKSGVQPVPAEPDKPDGFFRSALHAVVPGSAIVDQVSYEMKLRDRQETLENNVRVAETYVNTTGQREAEVKTEYPELGKGNTTVSSMNLASGPQTAGYSGSPTVGPGFAGYADGGSAAGGAIAGVPTVGTSRPGRTTGVADPDATRAAAAYQPAPTPGQPTGTDLGAAGIAPAPIPPMGGDFGTQRDAVRRGGPGSTDRLAGQRLTAKGAPGAAGPRSGAGPTSGNPNSGNSPGARTGAAPGGSTAPGAANLTKGPAAMGRGGTGMPGMIPPGGAAGGREEEKEHKDKYWQPEELDDGLQWEVDEHGKTLRDPRTGFVVPPSVIRAPWDTDDTTDNDGQ